MALIVKVLHGGDGGGGDDGDGDGGDDDGESFSESKMLC